MNIRIFEMENAKFTIHPDEELTYQIANLLATKDFCRLTKTLYRATGHSVGDGPTKWTGLITGFIVDEKHDVKDVVKAIAHEFNTPWYVIKENEYLVSDRPRNELVF